MTFALSFTCPESLVRNYQVKSVRCNLGVLYLTHLHQAFILLFLVERQPTHYSIIYDIIIPLLWNFLVLLLSLMFWEASKWKLVIVFILLIYCAVFLPFLRQNRNEGKRRLIVRGEKGRRQAKPRWTFQVCAFFHRSFNILFKGFIVIPYEITIALS